MDGHFGFSDSVHGGRYEGHCELDVFGETAGDVDLVEAKVDVARHQDEVIVSVGHTCGILYKDLLGAEAVYAIRENESRMRLQ